MGGFSAALLLGEFYDSLRATRLQAVGLLGASARDDDEAADLTGDRQGGELH